MDTSEGSDMEGANNLKISEEDQNKAEDVMLCHISDNSSSSCSSDTRSLTTDDWAALTNEPDNDYSASILDNLTANDSVAGLTLSSVLNEENIAHGNDDTTTQANTSEFGTNGTSDGNPGSCTSGAAEGSLSQLDTRKDYFHFNEVPLEKMIRMGTLSNEGNEKPSLSLPSIKFTCTSNSSGTQAANKDQDEDYPKSSDQGAECRQAEDQDVRAITPCGSTQIDCDSLQQDTAIKTTSESIDTATQISPPTHESNQLATREATEVKTYGRRCPKAPDPDTTPVVYNPDGTTSSLPFNLGSESSGRCVSYHQYSEIPLIPLQQRPRRQHVNSDRDSRLSRSASEHTYSSGNDFEAQNNDNTGLSVIENVLTSGTEIQVLEVQTNVYEKLYGGRRKCLQMNWNVVRCILLIFLSAVVVLGGLLVLFRELGFFQDQRETTVSAAATEIGNNVTVAPTHFSEADFHYATIGENVTLLWNMSDFNPDNLLECHYNHDSRLFRVTNFGVFYDWKAGDQQINAIIDKMKNVIGLTLINIAISDAGQYSCKQLGQKTNNITIFVWDKPLQARITKEGPLLKCDVTSTSQPEYARPQMEYIWRRSDSKQDTKTNLHYMTIPNQSKEAHGIYISCQGHEVGSPYSSARSEILLISPDDELDE